MPASHPTIAAGSFSTSNMRAIVQRVSESWVELPARSTDRSGPGLLALVGFTHGDDAGLLEPMAGKMTGLRIFEDESGKMNLSLKDTGGGLVLVPQFTLYADLRRGRRPGFSQAMQAPEAAKLFEAFVRCCAGQVAHVISGKFGASMQVHLTNNGPVTIILDSAELGY